MNLLDFFERAYVINLASRTDRRREMEHELRRADVGLRPEQLANQVEFFPAIRPTEAAPFTLVGRKGASLSFLSVLKDARARGLSRVLVLQDDAEFVPDFQRRAGAVLAELAARPWGVAQLGYLGEPVAAPADPAPRLHEFDGEVIGAHCCGVSQLALERLIALFERQHGGVDGDHRYGPMPVDGTINVFRWLNPELPRLLAVPSLAGQRSSRSDIIPGRFDRLPWLRPLVSFARGLRWGARRS